MRATPARFHAECLHGGLLGWTDRQVEILLPDAHNARTHGQEAQSMLRFRLIWLTALLLVVPSSRALAQSQAEMNETACAEYKKADAELNATYAKIRSEYKDDAAFLEKLQKALRGF